MKLDENVGSLTTKLGEVYFAQSEALGAVNFQSRQIAGLSKELAALKLKVTEKDRTIDKMSHDWNEKLHSMKKDVDENTKERRNRNMVIIGILECVEENCINTVVEFLRKLVPTITL